MDIILEIELKECENGDTIEIIQSLDQMMRGRVTEIHELRLVSNRIPKMPTRAFGSLRIQNLVLSNNGLETIGRQAFGGLEPTLRELVIEEPTLLSIPADTLAPLRELEVLSLRNTPVHDLEPIVGPSRLRFVHVDRAALLDIPPQAFAALPSLRFLHITNSAVRKLHPRAFHDLPALLIMNLTGNHITAIHPEAFSATPSLETLILDGNNVKDADMVSEAVGHLRSLRTLEMRNNDIERLPSRSFDRLESVENLILSGNELAEVHPAAFSRMPSLQVLDLSFTGLVDLHPETFDGTPRLAELYLGGNNVTLLAGVTRATRALPSLRVLDLSRNEVASVESGVFHGHHNLESLYLDRNKLSAVHMDAFGDLRSLRKLDLHDNYLTSDTMVRVGRPWRLPNLHTLVLSRNELTHIARAAFEHMPSVMHLDLRDNNIETLENGAFSALHRLEYLNVSHNKIQEIPQECFAKLGELRDLDLSYNVVEELGPGVLADLWNLRALHLKHNQISTFAPDALPPDSNLVFLDASENFIKDFEQWPMSARRRLKHLDLCWNEIEEVGEAFFENLESINTLLLANNMIKRLSTSETKPTKSLRTLDISGNQLQELDPKFPQQFSSLECLNASRNGIRTLPTLRPLSRLHTLDLCNNSLTRLEDAVFSGTTSLQYLDLSENILREINPGTFRPLGALRQLNLRKNELPSLPKDFIAGLWTLSAVDLSENGIENVQERAFNALPNVKEVDLSRNRIVRVDPGAFEGLSSLKSLRVEGNAIERLEGDVFRDTHDVKLVNLSHNFFDKFPTDALRSLKSVKVVDLSHNRILEVSQDEIEQLPDVSSVMLNDNNICKFHGSKNFRNRNITRMKTLDLHNNYLMYLPEEPFRDLMHTVNNLDVSGNPLMCDCELAWLRDIYSRQLVEEYDLQRRGVRRLDLFTNSRIMPEELQPRCYFPETHRGQSITEMSPVDFTCDVNTESADRGSGCSLLPLVVDEGVDETSLSTGTGSAGIPTTHPTPTSSYTNTGLGNASDDFPLPFHRMSNHYGKLDDFHDWTSPQNAEVALKSPSAPSNIPPATTPPNGKLKPESERLLDETVSSDFIPGDTPTIYAGSSLKPPPGLNSNDRNDAAKQHGNRKTLFGFPLPKIPVDFRLTFGLDKQKGKNLPSGGFGGLGSLLDNVGSKWVNSPPKKNPLASDLVNLPEEYPESVSNPAAEEADISSGSASAAPAPSAESASGPQDYPSLEAPFLHEEESTGKVIRPQIQKPTPVAPPESDSSPSSFGDFSSEPNNVEVSPPAESPSLAPETDKTRLSLPPDYFGGGKIDEDKDETTSVALDDIPQQRVTTTESTPTSSSTQRVEAKSPPPPEVETSSSNESKTPPTVAAVTKLIDNSVHHRPLEDLTDEEVHMPLEDMSPGEVNVFHKGTGQSNEPSFEEKLLLNPKRKQKASLPLPHSLNNDPVSWAGILGLKPPEEHELATEEPVTVASTTSDSRNPKLYNELEFMNKFVTNFREEIFSDEPRSSTNAGSSKLCAVPPVVAVALIAIFDLWR
ncbi:unnamed protein product [Notodromas monacha]|uniref:LRRCT domain-containing protein n=1 Tax=Notodromas monacha TaxID=399045 RepID=A0A7R9GFF7_9CRUS|nr:unnamed protein product [Notodromas monacha]CAG0919297.1 unnamed protein product [Notodromas monacha]